MSAYSAQCSVGGLSAGAKLAPVQANAHISTHGNTLTVRAFDADGFLADVGA
jgi:hypothetical protein